MDRDLVLIISNRKCGIPIYTIFPSLPHLYGHEIHSTKSGLVVVFEEGQMSTPVKKKKEREDKGDSRLISPSELLI